VLAKREVSRLFSDQGVYGSLFNPNTEALRLARSVEVVRAVDGVLDEVERDSGGVGAGVAVHGRRVIGHVVLRSLGDDFLKAPDSDVAAALASVPSDAREYLDKLVAVFPDNAYPGNVFKNQARVVELLAAAGLT
jgi:hypothetical protein